MKFKISIVIWYLINKDVYLLVIQMLNVNGSKINVKNTYLKMKIIVYILLMSIVVLVDFQYLHADMT